ncbi:ATP-binding protein [Rhizobium ruizarguesonis]|jgi:type II secretory pathway predicted ATPase ExeA
MSNLIADSAKLRALRVSVRGLYLENGKDGVLDAHLKAMVQNKKDIEEGAGSPRRGLFVIGKAGTGKSTSIRRAMSANPDLQPLVNAYGEKAPQYLSIKLPKKAATIDLVSHVLKAMGMPHDGKEKAMTDEMKNQFKQRGIWLLHLDELQHTVRSNTAKAYEAIQDLVKEMLDDEDWPLHMILSGVPRIRKIQVEDQIDRRSEVLNFYPLKAPANNDRIRELIAKISVEGCAMSLDPDVQTPEFYERLCMATNGAWGTMIERVQDVSFGTLERGKTLLTKKDFARQYEMTKGCPLSENVYMAPNFRDLDLAAGSEN